MTLPMNGALRALIVILLAHHAAFAQYSRYAIQLKDKKGTSHQLSAPSGFLSPRALERRTRYQLALDSTDLPVSATYLQALRSIPNIRVHHSSKWLNQVLIETTDAQALTQINQLPFVQSLAPLALQKKPMDLLPRQQKFNDTTYPINGRELRSAANGVSQGLDNPLPEYGNSYSQIHLHNGEYLHQKGFTGDGMVIAVLDGGFFSYLSNPALDSARNQQRILGTWDFVNNEPGVNEDHRHGFQCLSIIAANMPGRMIGSAPKASFFLFRTEDVFSEYPVEEFYWVAAAERADSAGADLITSSLGYSTFDDPVFDISYAERNGNTSIVTRGADLAARKGILVTNSAGNSGNSASEEKYIMCPGDGDSVCAVGAVDVTGALATFSCWGPNSAGKTKPNIVSVGQGTTLVDISGNVVRGNGTSYSNPLACGLIACLWQAFPERSNMEILDAVQKSAHLYQQPDQRLGYGIPDFKKAYQSLYERRELERLTGALGKEWIKAYPVPFQSSLKIIVKAPKTGPASIRLMDLYGRTLEMIRGSYIKDNSYILEFPGASRMNRGVLLIEYQDGEFRKVIRTLKL